jgi:hypothetical protein
MGPLMHLLSTTKVPELLEAARMALMRVTSSRTTLLHETVT